MQGSQLRRLMAAARSKDRRAARTGIGGRPPPQHGNALPRLDAPGAARARARQMGGYRKQPQGPLLRHHRRRPPPVCSRKSRVGPYGNDHASRFRGTVMRAIMLEWIRRQAGTFRRGRGDHEIEQELQGHLALAEEELRRRGIPPDAAAREARLRFGGFAQTMEIVRDQRGIPRRQGRTLGIHRDPAWSKNSARLQVLVNE
jgi:hypothetical protein